MTFVDKVKVDFKDITFQPSEKFRWAPESKVVFYNQESTHADWSLLHEVGHVICEHKNYNSDIGLLKMEVQAWQKARELAKKYNLEIDNKHIEKCLDSYRDWLYKRSSCPVCSQAGIEKNTGVYQCINCKKKWQVTPEKFCRVYRQSKRYETRNSK
jgi:hypothetical protein